MVSWPEKYGGRDAGLLNGISLLAPTLFDHGTEEQHARVLPPTAAGEVVPARARSEPETGCGLAPLTSRAVRTDGGRHLRGRRPGRRGRPSA
ncbi:hypothetical protein AV521_21760 [Streptomyces sp. IMTB 2501]|nr:hypothetical protein AV521_21760 [Streptomyces sp. IMTB 2501]